MVMMTNDNFAVTLERRARRVILELDCPTLDEAIGLFDELLAGTRRAGGTVRIIEQIEGETTQ